MERMLSNKSESSKPQAVVVVLGDSKVGKTTLIRRFLRRAGTEKDSKYSPTVEDYYSGNFIAHRHYCRVQFIDTAGSFQFPAMQRLWICRASAFLFVCSWDSPASLKTVREIYCRMREERPDDYTHIPTALVVNKQDLYRHSPPPLDEEDIRKVSEELQLSCHQIVSISALENDGIDRAFEVLWECNCMAPSNHKVMFEMLYPDTYNLNKIVPREKTVRAISWTAEPSNFVKFPRRFSSNLPSTSRKTSKLSPPNRNHHSSNSDIVVSDISDNLSPLPSPSVFYPDNNSSGRSSSSGTPKKGFKFNLFSNRKGSVTTKNDETPIELQCTSS